VASLREEHRLQV